MKKPFSRILVPLDLTSMDTLLIRYTSFLAQHLQPDHISFIHIMESYNLPKEVASIFDDLEEPVDEIIRKEVSLEVNEHYQGTEATETSVQVQEGNPTDLLLREADRTDTDLMIMGKKTGFQGKGILTGQVTRLIHCSALILPETSSFQLSKIQVPVDFSRHSKSALRQALNIAEYTKAEVLTQHVYHLPTHFFPYITPTEDMGESIEKHARREYDKFLKKVSRPKPDVRSVFMKDDGDDISQRIYDLAIKEGTDLIVVGSKGLTDTASYLIGSTAEKLTAYDKTIPLLIFKDKEDNYGILDFLFNR